ncbi:Uncharacterised protein [Legionella steigerwaltii]|uniref:Uncharacterized protein n=1 Tax=Legionella steigerwaltii TaxID=460 RepID=A0A378L9C3_9GAMM|nr:hypothetical protein [Legionella steigerwaltii]KTD80638.1 hypothetical protein Lstg_0474 [Legionella steigerwaltii]STY22522.1 Uncharacterised protein [Legionella steigerwaltii]
MGKNTQEQKAFTAAESMRQTLIDQLKKKCNSAKDLEGFLKKYEEKKGKNKRVSLTQHHQKIISDMDEEISRLIQSLNQKFSPVAQIEPSTSTYEQHEKVEKGTVEVLPEDFGEKNGEKQSLDTSVEIPTEELNAASLRTQSKVPLKTSGKGKNEEELGHGGIRKSVQFKTHSDEATQSGEASKTDKKHHVVGESRAKRHRTTQLSEVYLKLKTLHAKQIKYEEKAKEYRRKDQRKEQQYKDAAVAAKSIHEQITELCNQYLVDGDLELFKLKSQEILKSDKENVKTLKSHRGWWEEFLDGFVDLINRGFDRVGSSIRVSELSMFKPAADGGKKVDELTNSISSLTA